MNRTIHNCGQLCKRHSLGMNHGIYTASTTAPEKHREQTQKWKSRAHTANDPSSATQHPLSGAATLLFHLRTGRYDCNRAAPAEFAAAHG